MSARSEGWPAGDDMTLKDAVLAYAKSIDHPDHRIDEEGSDVCRECSRHIYGRNYWPCAYRRHAEGIRAVVAASEPQ